MEKLKFIVEKQAENSEKNPNKRINKSVGRAQSKLFISYPAELENTKNCKKYQKIKKETKYNFHVNNIYKTENYPKIKNKLNNFKEDCKYII